MLRLDINDLQKVCLVAEAQKIIARDCKNKSLSFFCFERDMLNSIYK